MSIPFGILKSIQFMIFHVAMISPFFLLPSPPWGVAFPFLLFVFLLQVIVYYYFTLYYLYRIIPSPWPGGLDWSSSIGVAFYTELAGVQEWMALFCFTTLASLTSYPPPLLCYFGLVC